MDPRALAEAAAPGGAQSRHEDSGTTMDASGGRACGGGEMR